MTDEFPVHVILIFMGILLFIAGVVIGWQNAVLAFGLDVFGILMFVGGVYIAVSYRQRSATHAPETLPTDSETPDYEYCPQCGTQNQFGALRCLGCGFELGAVSAWLRNLRDYLNTTSIRHCQKCGMRNGEDYTYIGGAYSPIRWAYCWACGDRIP
jgi:hypothetical protein